jgi:twitching motility two-component system response regulator PilH
MENFKVLITDDSFIARRKIGNFLKSINFEVDEATNGLEAFEKIKVSNYDLIILDLLMPEYDGLWLLEQLIAANITIPVIVISADIQETSKEKVLSLGASAFLNKPPKDNELKITLAKVLNIKELSND